MVLRLNRFKEVHYAPDQRRRNFKQLVQHYDELTAQQARLKTKLKARLRMQGVIVNTTHARLTVQRKIVSTLRAMWLTRTPYGDELSR